jgi:hypothetical protein
MKVKADKHRVERSFQVGDKMRLKLHPYTQASEVNQPFPKFSLKFFGPYIILEKIGSVVRKELENVQRGSQLVISF